MIKGLDQGIEISVETFYQKDYSNPQQHEFMHAYRITICNKNPFPVKLRGRCWHIFDSNGNWRKVEGEGVVGMQPVIKEFDDYCYVSGANMSTEMGFMYGAYEFENLNSKEVFKAEVPKFELVFPGKYN